MHKEWRKSVNTGHIQRLYNLELYCMHPTMNCPYGLSSFESRVSCSRSQPTLGGEAGQSLNWSAVNRRAQIDKNYSHYNKKRQESSIKASMHNCHLWVKRHKTHKNTRRTCKLISGRPSVSMMTTATVSPTAYQEMWPKTIEELDNRKKKKQESETLCCTLCKCSSPT